jgi:hypothetical protein
MELTSQQFYAMLTATNWVLAQVMETFFIGLKNMAKPWKM